MAGNEDSVPVLNTSTLVTGFTEGSVIFIDSTTTLQEDNANFFWDDTDNRLGIGDNTPSEKLTINTGADTEDGLNVYFDGADVGTPTLGTFTHTATDVHTASSGNLVSIVSDRTINTVGTNPTDLGVLMDITRTINATGGQSIVVNAPMLKLTSNATASGGGTATLGALAHVIEIDINDHIQQDARAIYIDGVGTNGGGIEINNVTEAINIVDGEVVQTRTVTASASPVLSYNSNTQLTTGTQSSSMTNLQGTLQISGTGAHSGTLVAGTEASAFKNSTSISSSGTIGEVYGSVSNMNIAFGTSATTTATAAIDYFTVPSFGGNATNAVVSKSYFDNNASLGGGTFTNVTGHEIEIDMSNGTHTNAYGLRVLDITGATNNFAIQTGTGLVDFGDHVLALDRDVLRYTLAMC